MEKERFSSMILFSVEDDRVDASETGWKQGLYENCKDMAILVRIFFKILESIRTSGHGLETTNEL